MSYLLAISKTWKVSLYLLCPVDCTDKRVSHLLGIFLHGPLEESLAPLAGPDAVVLARRVVPAHRAQQPRPARLAAGAVVGGGRPRPPVGQRGRRGRRRAQRVADNLWEEMMEIVHRSVTQADLTTSPICSRNLTT